MMEQPDGVFKCDFCSSTYSTLAPFLEHFRISHKNKDPFIHKCPICRKEFRTYKRFRECARGHPSFNPHPTAPPFHPLPVVHPPPPPPPPPPPQLDPIIDTENEPNIEPEFEQAEEPMIIDEAEVEIDVVKQTAKDMLDFASTSTLSHVAACRAATVFQKINTTHSTALKRKLKENLEQFIPPAQMKRFNETIDTVFESSSAEVVSGMKTVTSTHLQRKFLIEEYGMIPPVEIWPLGVNGQPQLLPNGQLKSFQYVPIIKQIEKLLNNPAIFRDVTRPIAHSEELSEVAHGKFVRESCFFNPPNPDPDDDTIKLQIILSGDDAEMGAPLQSRATVNSLCFIFFTIGNLSPRFRSRNSSIFLSLVARTKLIKEEEVGYDAFFEPLVSDLKKLEEGVEMRLNGADRKVAARVVMLIGDNKAKCEFANFFASFSGGQCCSMCMTSYDDMARLFDPAKFVWRTPAEHNRQIAEMNFPGLTMKRKSEIQSQYGLHGSSILNTLGDFHVSTHMIVEMQHDILHGSLPMVITAVLIYATKGVKNPDKKSKDPYLLRPLFKLATFNELLSKFKFGYTEVKNRPLPIKRAHLAKFPQVLVHQNDVQMWQLGVMIPILIGRYFIRETESAHRLRCLVTLLEFMRIAFAYKVNPAMIEYCTGRTSFFCQEMVRLFAQLRPKQHFNLHIPRHMVSFGALRTLNTLAFERQHYFSRLRQQVSKNYKNSAKTIANSIQKKLCLDLRSQDYFREKHVLTFVKEVEITPSLVYRDCLQQFLNCAADATVRIAGRAIIGGTEYRRAAATLMVSVDEKGLPTFGLTRACIEKDNELAFVVHLLRTVKFDKLAQAFQVESAAPASFLCVKHSELITYQPFIVHKSGNCFYIIVRESLPSYHQSTTMCFVNWDCRRDLLA